jgi:hypothetical protein
MDMWRGRDKKDACDMGCDEGFVPTVPRRLNDERSHSFLTVAKIKFYDFR